MTPVFVKADETGAKPIQADYIDFLRLNFYIACDDKFLE